MTASGLILGAVGVTYLMKERAYSAAIRRLQIAAIIVLTTLVTVARP